MRASIYIYIYSSLYEFFIFVSDSFHCFLRLLVIFYFHSFPTSTVFSVHISFVLQMYYNSMYSTSVPSTCFACCCCRITRHLSVPHHWNRYCFRQCSLAWISLHCVPDKISSVRRTTRAFCSYSLSLPLVGHHCSGLRYGQMPALPGRDTFGLWVVHSRSNRYWSS